jgi:hypothetical protein
MGREEALISKLIDIAYVEGSLLRGHQKGKKAEEICSGYTDVAL